MSVREVYFKAYVPRHEDDDMYKKPIIRAVTRISSGKFNTSDFTSWEVDSTSDLRELLIEDDCFGYVKDLKLSLVHLAGEDQYWRQLLLQCGRRHI